MISGAAALAVGELNSAHGSINFNLPDMGLGFRLRISPPTYRLPH